MARVYVSSTVADLKRERRAVMEWLVAAGYQPVHSYLPNSDTVRDSCLEDVDGCDLYVLILGHRYGFQPPQDNPEGLSITHLEFRRAEQSRKPRIALLRTSIPDVSLSDLADPQKLALVSAFREEVARQVRPAEFSDLRGLIQGLSTGVQAEPAKRSPATGRSRALFPPPVLDVEPRGRGQVTDELARLALAAPGHAVVLAGLGGSGKSTVARAVAARVLEQERRAWWVPAADAVSVTQLLLGLAGELGASRGQIKDALAGRLNPSDVLWQQLETTAGWMLVLDNADDPAALKAGDRPVTSGSGWLRSTRAGLVLATSRVGDLQRWGPIARILPLDSLGETDGAQVLLDLAPGAGNRAEAEGLSGQLGGLPLALHQAGSYLASPFAAEATFAQYRQALPVRFGELMGRGEEDRAKVIATWELSLDALKARGTGQARLLLRVLSCLAPAVLIPPGMLDRAVLARACQQGEQGAAEGLAALATVGLITTHPGPAGTWPGVTVHPLVTETNRLRLDAEDPGPTGGIAVALLTAAAAGLGYDRPEDWPAWVQLVPHLTAVWGHIASRLTDSDLAALAEVTGSAAQAFLWAGSYPASAELAGPALGHAAARLGADHPAVLALRHQVASAHMYDGDYAEAKQELREVLAARRRVLGTKHPDTLETQHVIAWMLASHDEYDQAEKEFRDVLAARLQVLGQDHPDTLNTRNGIAWMLSSQAKYEQAEREFSAVLAARRRVLGPDHPDTLNTRHGIARMLDWRGDHEQAEKEFRDVLAAMRQVLGPDHPDTLDTRHEIAQLLANRGQSEPAEREFRDVLAAMRRVLGPDHPSTRRTQKALTALGGQP